MNPLPSLVRVATLTLLLAVTVSSAPAVAQQPAAAAFGPPVPNVTLDARLHQGALLLNGDGVNYMRVRVDAARVKMEKRLPLNVVLVIDRSGSMSGAKIRNVRAAAKFVIDQLQDGDIVSVVSFDNGAEILQPAAPVDSLDREAVKRRIERLRDRGGTDMVSGLRTGLEQAKTYASTDRVNRVILLSDGLPDTERGLRKLAASGLSKGIFVTTMGVGTDYNEDLMAALADAGNGNYYFIEKATAVAGIFQAELKDLMAVVAREGVIRIRVHEGVTVKEVYGYESSARKDGVTVPVGDLFGGRSVELLVRLETPVAAAASAQRVADVEFSFHDAIANRASGIEARLSQDVTEDEARVRASVDKEVGVKVVKVEAARAKKEAMTLWEQGKREKAKEVLGAAAGRARASSGAIAVAEDSEAEAASLDDLAREMQKPAAAPAAKALRKKAKKAARDAMR